MAGTSVRRSVGIVAFDEMEVLDFAGPYEVFNVAGELATDAGFEVAALGLGPGAIGARGGFTVLPASVLGDGPAPEVLIVPGGSGTRALLRQPEVIERIQEAAAGSELVVSVCTGALVLAAAGLLAGCPATTHHDAYAELAAISPSTRVVEDRRFVQSSERIWTSGGISAGIDLSLHLVALLAGEETRERVVAEMEWGWHALSGSSAAGRARIPRINVD